MEPSAERSHYRFPFLTVLLGLSGWIGLFFSSHSKLISTAAAAIGAVVWTVIVGVTSKIWARIEKTIVELAGDALDIYIRDFASRYRKRYLEHLQHRHRTFDVKGLSTQGIYSLEIEQVYVELTIDPTQPGQATSNPIPKMEGGRYDIWTFLGSPQMTRQDFAILGAPGSGKTTLLKHITLGLAAKRGKFRGVTRLPVLLFIREHAAAIGANPKQTIADIAQDAAVKMGIPAPAGWFGRELKRGRCLVMLDGLDEVADAALRKTVAEWVENQLQAFGANRFLVTSRPFGYRSNPLDGVTVLEVRPFSADQGERFITNWYLANEVMSAQKNDEGVRIAAREGASDLLKRIRANPALSELAVNPLLLTMIANVHRYRSSLPGRRVELYAEICEVFLGKRQQARGMELELTPAQKKRVLQPLAFHMMCAEKREISSPDAVQAIAESLALVDAKMDGEEFLRMVENSSGLLLERESGVYSFAHLTFQEYLASSHCMEEKLEEDLARQVAIPWWHEVIRLYVATADATRVVEACLGELKIEKLTLAVECLAEARAVRPDLRTKVESIVTEGLESANAAVARLAAETKLALRLRKMARIDDDHYVDSDLISCAEYQLFIDERQAAGDYRQPDHWSEPHFPSGTAQQPVLGVRPSDAEEFCIWLSERQGGEWSYQIPDADLPDETGGHAGYWAGTPGGVKLTGVSSMPSAFMQEILEARLANDAEAIKAVPYLNPNHARALGLDRDLARALELNHYLDLLRVLDLTPYRAVTHARALDLDYDRDLVKALDLNLSFVRFRSFDRELDLDLAHYHAMTRVFSLGRALFLSLDRGPTFVHDLSRTPREFESDLALDLALGRVRRREQAIALDHNLDRELVTTAKYFLGDRLDRRFARAISRFMLLLSRRQCERLSYQNVGWYARLLRRRYKLSLAALGAAADAARRLYLDLVLLEERIAGKLPAFEGIRIMKVRKAALPEAATAAKAASNR